jgi:predicted nucleotidyltransferase
MIGLLENKREALAKICARYGVTRLDAFGSALRDDFKPDESDLDLLVEFAPMEPYARVDAYFGMLDELRVLLNRKIRMSSLFGRRRQKGVVVDVGIDVDVIVDVGGS